MATGAATQVPGNTHVGTPMSLAIEELDLDQLLQCVSRDGRPARYVAVHGSDPICSALLCQEHGEILIERLAKFWEHYLTDEVTLSCRFCGALHVPLDETWKVIPITHS